MKKPKRSKITKYVFPLGSTGRTQLVVYLRKDRSPEVHKVKWDKNFESETTVQSWK